MSTTASSSSSSSSSTSGRRALPFAEQLVIVSGGSRGLGAAIVRAFAREGARVVINFHKSEEAAHALARELGNQALPWRADVRDPTAVQAMVAGARAHFKAPVTTLVSNALVDYRFDPVGRATADGITWGHYAGQLEGSVRGALNLLQAALPQMAEQGGGRFITIGTNLVQNPVVPYHDYAASKAALLAFTRHMAAELGPRGITCNMVSGGLLDKTDASAATSDAIFDLIRATTPLREVVSPAAMADAVLFFASPWSRAVTGQNMIVDGGLVMG